MRRAAVFLLFAAGCQFKFDRALRPGEIRGTLVYETAGAGERKPARGARVRLLGTTIGALADERGDFRFPDLPAGDYRLSATFALPPEAGGGEKVVLVQGLRIAARPAAAGKRERNGVLLGTLVVNALGEVAGTVLKDGAPVVGARVVASGYGEAPAGAEGRYRLKLPRGDFELLAAYPDQPETRVTARAGVKLRETATLDFRTTSTDAAEGAIAGVARLAAGPDPDEEGPHGGIRIRLRAPGGRLFPDAPIVTGADGAWTAADVPAGIYTLQAAADGFHALALAAVAVFPGSSSPPIMLSALGGDCDRDGTPDDADTDDDNDGTADADEAPACACDPAGSVDFDGDGACEVAHGPLQSPFCAALAAAGRRCGPGEACLDDRCADIAPVCDPACGPGRACVDGACADAPADSCPQGCPPSLVCVLGQCMADRDGDGIADAIDLCPDLAGAAQTDADHDRIGDACDLRPTVPDLAFAGGAPLPAPLPRQRTAGGQALAGAAGEWVMPLTLEGTEVRIQPGPSALGGAVNR